MATVRRFARGTSATERHGTAAMPVGSNVFHHHRPSRLVAAVAILTRRSAELWIELEPVGLGYRCSHCGKYEGDVLSSGVAGPSCEVIAPEG